MIDYVTQEDTCRSAYLLEYFGQTDSADCGTCDVCRRDGKPGPSKKQNTSSSDIKDTEHSLQSSQLSQHTSQLSAMESDFDELQSELMNFVNKEKAGVYTLDEIKSRFVSANLCSPDSLMTLLRELIDRGTIPPPQL
jgi:ATP-dependent DNA helicase RecQ